ncbi:MAG: hypothetical protein LBG17_07865 [Bacteroidales bacterium]|jgi:hypothetical protein|nr:hypothetical protein [Bacteroidales bacterium]
MNQIKEVFDQLQQELPELRGFLPINLKRMRQFYEMWKHVFVNRQPITEKIRPLSTDKIEIDLLSINRPLLQGFRTNIKIFCPMQNN